jgi:7 transmembrane helices usually fused to an inactive transglutaminase/Transglutaminase-like superfamily
MCGTEPPNGEGQLIMSRTTLCVLTAAALAAASLGAMALRRAALGDQVGRPFGPGCWKVTLAVQGTSLGSARLMTATPLDLERQHVLADHYESAELACKPPEARRPQRRQVLWTQRGGAQPGPFHALCTFQIAIESAHSNGLLPRLASGLYAPPGQGEDLDLPASTGPGSERLTQLARDRSAGLEDRVDVAEALYHFVDREVGNEPSLGGTPAGPAECLGAGRGDCGAKSRLLVTLLRLRGVPARIMTGLALSKGTEQRAHHWVEAWVQNRWLPMCPFYHHFGRVPPTYLVLGNSDEAVVRGRNVKDVDYAFLVERVGTGDLPAEGVSPLRRAFTAISLYALPPAERRLVEVLLLLPVAALIICVFRNVIGLNSFGTFAPALVGLAFRELRSLPGILVFMSVLLVGWLMRRVLDQYHLLQVPRIALMLTLIMLVLIGVVVGANHFGASLTTYISLFPLVILTGMVERFWTLETEDSTAASFRTLFSTMLISTVIALVLSMSAVVQQLFRYPETLGLLMAGQLLIGRYTGFRLTELLRFRDFVTPPRGPTGYLAPGVVEGK